MYRRFPHARAHLLGSLLPIAIGTAACDDAPYDFAGEDEKIGFSTNLVIDGHDHSWSPRHPVATGTEVVIQARVRLGKGDEGEHLMLTEGRHFDSWADASDDTNPCSANDRDTLNRLPLVVYGNADDSVTVLSREEGAGTGARVKHCGSIVLTAQKASTAEVGFFGSDLDHLSLEFAQPTDIDFDLIGKIDDISVESTAKSREVVLLPDASVHAMPSIRDTQGRSLGYANPDLSCVGCDPGRPGYSENSIRIDAGDTDVRFTLNGTPLGTLSVRTIELDEVASLHVQSVDLTQSTRARLSHRWQKSAGDLHPLFLTSLEQGMAPTLDAWDSAFQTPDFWTDLENDGYCTSTARHSPPRSDSEQQLWNELCSSRRLGPSKSEESWTPEARDRKVAAIQREIEVELKRPEYLDSSCEFMTASQAYARLGSTALQSVAEIQFDARTASGASIFGEVPQFSCRGVVALEQTDYLASLDTHSSSLAAFLHPRFALIPGHETGTVTVRLGTHEDTILLTPKLEEPLILHLDARHELTRTIRRLQENPQLLNQLPNRNSEALPRSASAVNSSPKRWRTRPLKEAMPNPMTFGAYWSEESAEGHRVIHGVADLDGDGILMHMTATGGDPPKLVSEDGVR